MPENTVTPTQEEKKPDASAKASDAQAPFANEQKSPSVQTPQAPMASAPAEKKSEDPTKKQSPTSKEGGTQPKQPEDKGKSAAKPKQADAPQSVPEEKKTTVGKNGEEKKAISPSKKPTPAEQKKPDEKKEDSKTAATDPGLKVDDSPRPEAKTPAADPKAKTVDVPKKETAKGPIAVNGKVNVEIFVEPKSAESTDAPKTAEPKQSESKAETAVDLAQDAVGPKGISITQVFEDRLAPPSEADLKKLPIPKEGEAFSMRLHPAYFFEFLEHPFSINRETKDYKDLRDSIKENGIRDPVYCRPREKGGLEIISGHRRHDIGTELNYPIPTIIVQADDDTARIAVVDGNLHRMDIPTSELARAAKMKMEALTRKAGRRSKMEQLTAPQKRSDQQVADDMGMSRNQVQRLVRIDSLVPELKQQVDDKKLPFNTAVELSYMNQDEQKKVVDFMQKEQITPSMAQATALKEASKHAATLEKYTPSLAPEHKVDEKKIASIIKPKKEPELRVTLTADELRGYFPDKQPTVAEAKRAIFDGLDMRKKVLEKQAKKQDIKNPAR